MYVRTFMAILCSLCFSVMAEEIFLRDHLMQAKPGDFIVSAQNRNYTVLMIMDKTKDSLVIQEVTVPEKRFPKGMVETWREWITQGAPGHTSWVGYEIAPYSGEIREFYSYSKQAWCQISDGENILGTLLNLRMHRIEDRYRRRVGRTPPNRIDHRPFWQPPLIVEGKEILGVPFDAWRSRWPKDGSDLSGKTIEVYLPSKKSGYPSYFPYWLQVSGFIGKARIRIVDSGHNLKSPQPLLPRRPGA